MREWIKRLHAAKPGTERARVRLEYVIAQPDKARLNIVNGVIGAADTLSRADDLQLYGNDALRLLREAMAPDAPEMALQVVAKRALDLLNKGGE